MTKRFIQTLTQGKCEAKIYIDRDWDEYRVQFFIDGKHLKDCDYHVDSGFIEDAIGTATAELTRMQIHNQ